MSKQTHTADVGSLSQWALIRMRFGRHRLAKISLRVLVILYIVAIFVEFFAPYTSSWHDLDHMYSPPQLPRWNLSQGFYTYPVTPHADPITFEQNYFVDRNKTIPLGFFTKGEPYKLLGLIPCERHFFGVRT